MKLNYSIDGGVWQQMTDTAYPFEFSVDINTASIIEYSVNNGTTTSSIFKYERLKPTATMNGWTSVNKAVGAILPIDFTGLAPYEISYSENGNIHSISGIETSPYLLKVNPENTSRYKLLSVKDGTNTDGEVAGDAKVVILDGYETKQTFGSTKDAQTYKASATINYGSEAQIELKGSSTYRRDLYFTFNIPSITLLDKQRVLIKLWVNGTSRLDAPYLTTLIKATSFSGTWQESLITWNNQPIMTNTQVVDTVAVSYLTPVPGFISLDITKFIKSGYSGDLNFKLEYCKGEDVASIYIASKEDPDISRHPYIAIVEQTQTANYQLFDNSNISVYPTIIKNYFEVNGRNSPFEIWLFDFTGKQLIHLHNQVRVNSTALPFGIYQVIIRDSKNQMYNSKIIKKS